MDPEAPAPRTPTRLGISLSSLEPFLKDWATTVDRTPSSSPSYDTFGPTEPDRPFPHFPDSPGDHTPSSDADTTLALLLPLLILLSTLLFLLILFLVFLIAVRRRRGSIFGNRGGIRLGDQDGPVDLGRDDESWAEGEGGVEGMERRWLEAADEAAKIGYTRAKVWQTQYPPNSLPTDITLSQFLSIQEKGVSAWSFEPDYDTNPSLPVFVQSRTEITFLGDGAGMAPEEGGGVCVMSNLPLPKLNEVYYWECKMYEKPEGTNVAIGLATKPYPTFRLPGWNRLSVGYFSSDGFKYHNYPFTGASYGPPLREGDVLGIGYRPRSGSVFFTRNGRKLDEAYVGLSQNVFPTVGADSAAVVHVNLGQAGFVFIEANVKKWGLAPMAGTLAPPPAYGHQMGSILLATADQTRDRTDEDDEDGDEEDARQRWTEDDVEGPSAVHRDRRRRVSGRAGADVRPPQVQGGLSVRGANQPAVPSPLRSSSLRRRVDEEEEVGDEDGEGEDEGSDRSGDSEMLPHNPPTPRPLDISLEEFVRSDDPTSPPLPGALPNFVSRRSGRRSRRRHAEGQREGGDQARRSRSRPVPYEAAVNGGAQRGGQTGGPSPPRYSAIDPHKYAAGVAEAMLADHFPGLVPGSSAVPSGPFSPTSSSHHPHPQPYAIQGHHGIGSSGQQFRDGSYEQRGRWQGPWPSGSAEPTSTAGRGSWLRGGDEAEQGGRGREGRDGARGFWSSWFGTGPDRSRETVGDVEAGGR